MLDYLDSTVGYLLSKVNKKSDMSIVYDNKRKRLDITVKAV